MSGKLVLARECLYVLMLDADILNLRFSCYKELFHVLRGLTSCRTYVARSVEHYTYRAQTAIMA